jgi:tetratricopeptide (TPR) repeat protein
LTNDFPSCSLTRTVIRNRARTANGMTSAALLFADGVKLHQAGRLADAEQIYHRILATLPDHFDCLHLLGLIFLQRGHHAQAVEQIDTALKRQPDNIFALNNRGIALKELKRLDEALASYDRALAVRPDYAEALSNRGNTLRLLQLTVRRRAGEL